MTVQQQGRELTADEQQERAEVAYAIDQRVKAGLRAGREALWQTAEALFEFDEHSAHLALGYETLGDWLGDPEVGMTRSTYYRLVKAWRSLVVTQEVDRKLLAGLDVSKVDVVLPAIESGKISKEDALEDARELGWRDLREKYVGPKDPPPPPPEPETETGDFDPIDPDAEPVGADEVGGAEPDFDPAGDGVHVPSEADEKVKQEVSFDDDPSIIEGKASEPKAPKPKPEPAPPPRGAAVTEEVFREAQRAWRALYSDLDSARNSGQEAPRVDANLITPGLDGLLVLVDQDVTADELLGGIA